MLTGDGFIAVGDASRDLVPNEGGLLRQPVTLGFAPYLSACMTRRIGMFSDLSGLGVLSSSESEHAGRPAVDLELRKDEHNVVLGVDAETGIWTWLHSDGFTITVDELAAEPVVPAAAFDLLDLVPDIDLSHREPVAPALSPILEALQKASGLQVEVLYQDEETGAFTFLLLEDGQVQALIDRTDAESTPRPAVFGGVQHRWDTEDWTYTIDAVTTDRMWPRPIVRALERF